MSPTNHHHHLPLTLLLSNLLLTSAIPALPPLDFNPSTLIIQPNTGGGQADDCGAGPITLDANTWNAQNMDSVIRNFWDAGVSRPNFDFHQEFADQYGVDLYCPNSFTNCEGDPSSCSQLKGTTAQKTQGWLGIKAMMSVQDMFLQWEKVVSNAADGLTTLVVDFQQKFSPPDVPAAQTGRKFLVNIIGGALGGAATLATVANPVAAAGVALIAALVTAVVNDSFDDKLAAADGTDLSVTNLSDRWGAFKLQMLEGIDLSHSAAFSNGFVDEVGGPKMKDILLGGSFAGTTVPQAYDTSEANLQGIVRRLMVSKLLETTWKDAYNSFLIYVPNVIDQCAGWHGNTGKDDVLRYCAPTGMFLLHNINPEDKAFGAPPGANNEDVGGIGNFGIQLQSLLKSSADMYLTHGLINTGIAYFLPEIVQSWFAQPDASIFAHQGMFTLPVCELQYYNWRQSDNAGSGSPPCDCVTAQDQWGGKFMDVAQEDVKAWINKSCH